MGTETLPFSALNLHWFLVILLLAL